MRALLLLLAVVVSGVQAQSYPSKPIRLIVGYPPGGSGDFTSRVAADELGKDLGASVVVENRPGAGGNIAAELVAKAPADGYTILNAWHHAINLALYKSSGYQEKDFIPISRVANGATVVVVNNATQIFSLKDLISFAKANPGKLFNASAGFGSTPHLASALFESVAGVQFTSVQFKGGGPAAQSIIAGETQVMFATSPTVMGFIRAGRISGHSRRRGSRPAGIPRHFLVRPVRARRHAAGRRRSATPGRAARHVESGGEGKNRAAGNGRRAFRLAAGIRR
jgi:tripartite-type tricarboxylate transporter receptor subunit TctC